MLVCHCTVSIKVVLILAFPTTQIFCPWTFLRYFESIFNSSVTVALSVARYTVVVKVPAFSYRIPYRIFMKVLRSSISMWFIESANLHVVVLEVTSAVVTQHHLGVSFDQRQQKSPKKKYRVVTLKVVQKHRHVFEDIYSVCLLCFKHEWGGL